MLAGVYFSQSPLYVQVAERLFDDTNPKLASASSLDSLTYSERLQVMIMQVKEVS